MSAHFRDTLPADTKFDVENSGFAIIHFEDGLVMHFEATCAANVTGAIPKAGGVGHELENTTIFGERATLSLNPATLCTMDGKELVETPLEVVEGTAPFVAQMDNFLDAVRTGNAPVNNLDQAVSLMKILMAIYDSSATGAEVRLD